MRRLIITGSQSEFEEIVNNDNISILQVDVKPCEQSYMFQECFIASIYFDDSPNSEQVESPENSPASPVQQLKAKIRASLDRLCNCSPLEISKAIDEHVAEMRELSAVYRDVVRHASILFEL